LNAIIALKTMVKKSQAFLWHKPPNPIMPMAQALTVLGTRRVTVGRELTKQFEHIHTLPAQELSDWLQAQSERQKGEFVLVIHDAPVEASTGEGLRVLQLLLPELPLKTAVKLAAEISGESKNHLYDQALALKNATGD
jgi:16S rRNA (cytidine1402-2'-O)-methyltransferase